MAQRSSSYTGAPQQRGSDPGGTDCSSKPQYGAVRDQQVRGHSGTGRDDIASGVSGFSPAALHPGHTFSSTGGPEHQAVIPMSSYGTHTNYMMLGQAQQHSVLKTAVQQASMQLPYAQYPPPFPIPDPNQFLHNLHQYTQGPHPMQLSHFESEVPATAVAHHAHLNPTLNQSSLHSTRTHGVPLKDESHVHHRFQSPVGVYGDSHDRLEFSLVPTTTWPPQGAPGWQFHRETYATSSSHARDSSSSDGLSGGHMYAPPARRSGSHRLPQASSSRGQPTSSGLYNVPFTGSRAPLSPSPPLQVHSQKGGQGSPNSSVHGHRHVPGAAHAVPTHAHPSDHPSSPAVDDHSLSPEYPFSGGVQDEYSPSCALSADACAPQRPSSTAPSAAFLRTIHELEDDTAVQPERKLHNQSSQCSTATSVGEGSRRFLARNISSFPSSSFGSRNSSIRSYNTSFRSIGGVSSYDMHYDSFRELPEPCDDTPDPSPTPLQNVMPTGAAELSSSPTGCHLSAVHLTAVEALAAAEAEGVAGSAVNAAAAAAAIMSALGDVPSYLSEQAEGASEHERMLVSDMARYVALKSQHCTFCRSCSTKPDKVSNLVPMRGVTLVVSAEQHHSF
jgi:hypothetical protein